MKHRILKTKTINNLQDDVCNCISDSTKTKFVQDLSDKLLEHEEVAADNVSEQSSTETTSSDDGKEEKAKDVCFFDYDPPNDWYMTLFNTILDYCASNKITDTDTLKQGIRDLLTSFLKYDDVIHYLQTAKGFVVVQSEHLVLDTKTGITWNTGSFPNSYKGGRSYSIRIGKKIQKKSFSKIFADSEICCLFKAYNKSGFKPYNPLKDEEQAAYLNEPSFNNYKPVFKEEPLVDKNLEKRFRYGARFLLKVLWDYTEHSIIKLNWLLGYIAHMVQYPAVVVQQCIAINGRKNIGKNTIFKLVADLFGIGVYGDIKQNMNGLTGTFNTDLYHKVVIIYDETKDVKNIDRIIKGIVGNPVIGIERKGKDKEVIDNFSHIFFLSNEIDVSFSVGERHLVGFFPTRKKRTFTRFYEDCLNDPSVKEKFIHWLWHQLTMLDFKKLGYDPFVYPDFAKRDAQRIIEDEPQNLEQCVFASMRQWHKELADNLTRLEQAEKITSDIFDKAMLINIKSSIGTKHRYKSTDGSFSTPLYSLVLYCARSAFERGFTKIQTKQEVFNGAITSIYCPDWEIIKNIKSILGKIYVEYDIYKKKQNDNRYLIPHPAEVLMAIDN